MIPKYLNLWKGIAVLSIILLLIMLIAFQQNRTAHADAHLQVTVTASTLNVREAATLSSKIVGQVHKGDIFEVLQAKNNWDQIEWTNGHKGWVLAKFVKETNAQAEAEAVIISKVKGLNVHESPDLNSPIIFHISPNQLYIKLDDKGSLIEIKTPEGPGWVTSRLVIRKIILKSTGVNLSATVKANFLNVRENPDPASKIVGVLKSGSHLTIKQEKSGWAKIIASTGEKGWVSEDYLKVQVAKELVEAASTTTASSSKEDSNSQSEKTKITDKENVLQGKTIVLDPGHGGKDKGTTSVSGIPEKDLTFATVKRVEQKLEAAGAKVEMTRSSDNYPSLQDRVDLSEKVGADAFISFHYNSSPFPFIRGLSGFYYNKSKDKALAKDLLDEIAKETGLDNRGVRFNNLHVLRTNSQPSALIELGFLSNRKEAVTVETESYQEKVAQAVYIGLLNYFAGI